MSKRALITGITGQDGSYLAELLLRKDYEVHGLVRSTRTISQSYIRHLDQELKTKQLVLHKGSLEDADSLRQAMQQAAPEEVYHLAGPSNVRLSFVEPEQTMDCIGLGTLRFLEILRQLPHHPPKFLNASSCEVFGSPQTFPQDETTPMRPITPYGAAKALAQQLTTIYRESYELPVCSAILYNHESPRRNPSFVTQKIAQAAARISRGLTNELVLNNLTARRDWGWSPDYAEGMWLMLQQDHLEDFVLATGRLHSVEDLVTCSFEYVGLDWRHYVMCDTALTPVTEPSASCGNPTKAAEQLGWQCAMPIEEIMQRMIDAEMAIIESGNA